MDFLPPAAANDLYALLQVVADPERHKKALDALKAHSDVAREALAGAQEAQRAVDAAKGEIAEQRSILEKDAAAAHTALDVRDRQMKDHEARLASESDRIAKWDAAVKAREDTVKAAEREAKKRDIGLDARERRLADALTDLEEREAHCRSILAEIEPLAQKLGLKS